jgi:hypothetical protein
MAETRRAKLERQRLSQENERSSFIPHWRDIADYMAPRRIQLDPSDRNKGDKRNQKIVDSTATVSVRTAKSGLMSGVTSPARPWFNLGAAAQVDKEDIEANVWLHDLSEQMRGVFLKSNLYEALPTIYEDYVLFGQACGIIEEDFDEVVRIIVLPIGSYCIKRDSRGRPCGFSRTLYMTVSQIIDKFATDRETGEVDFSNVSESVKVQYERGLYEQTVLVCHQVYKNEMYNASLAETDAKFKRYSDVYYELSTGVNGQSFPATYDKFLMDSGRDRFNIVAPAWQRNSEDVYGVESPGMLALPDVKQLQLMVRRHMQALEKSVWPPLVGPTYLQNHPVSALPGDITYVDVREGQAGLRPIHEVRPDFNALDASEQVVRERIKKIMFEDLFLLLANLDRREITAREIEERAQEKMWVLGPVLESLNRGLLDPLIEITFEYMLRQGLVLPPPPSIAGSDLKIEYVSVMANAQRAVGIASVERLAGFIGQIASVDPSVLDKVDLDQMVDEYGIMVGAPPSIVRQDGVVAEIRSQRAQAQQQQRQMDMIEQAASAAKDASQVDPAGLLGV